MCCGPRPSKRRGFWGAEEEFGTITPGRRADLVLVTGNPLDDLDVLRKPAGVMVRGRWLPATELETMLAAMRVDTP